MVGLHEAGREIDITKFPVVNPQEEMNWKQFLKALLISECLSGLCGAWCCSVTQHWLPSEPGR